MDSSQRGFDGDFDGDFDKAEKSVEEKPTRRTATWTNYDFFHTAD
jgi:hypothetical protein